MSGNTDRKIKTAIVWFRNDLRLADNRALVAACETADVVIPLFILEDGSGSRRLPGGARQWWLHHSLESLAEALRDRGAPLVLRRGAARTVLKDLIGETGADAVYWNRRYDPAGIAIDSAVKAWLRSDGLVAESFDGTLLHEPTRLKTGQGNPYRVYTPFWRAFEASDAPREPIAAPKRIPGPADRDAPRADALPDLALLPTAPDWSGGIAASWLPGEDHAHDRLKAFVAKGLKGYAERRDLPFVEGTSRLSPHLAFGELTPFQVWHATRGLSDRVEAADLTTFRKELVWREFSYHLLVNFPDLAETSYDRRFEAFPWADDGKAMRAWQKGMTGYPIVDAGMRQLWQTGWMHNRVRMIVASFLTKHLLLDWRKGEAWFWDTLVDADPASNAASWQWVAGSGADAAPYFRIFNPVLQGEKFDPDGAYVRHFVPELARLDTRFIHKPWEAPKQVLAAARITLGKTYPEPVVDHKKARERALDAYSKIKDAA